MTKTKVALVRPPILGHALRGTGVYFNELHQSLSHISEVDVQIADLHALPQDVDVFHFPYFDPFFLTLPQRMPNKSIVTIHDLIPLKFPKHFPPGLKGGFKWHLQKRAVRQSAAIITDSKASKNDIVDILNISPSRVFSIYLAASSIFSIPKTSGEKEKIRKEKGLPTNFALYVGDTNWNKNLPNVITACVQSGLALVIVSKSLANSEVKANPWNESLLKAQELVQKNPAVQVLGFVKENELVSLYQMAEALLLPSYYEGFGLPVVEAFVSGCPVITSALGSLKEIAGNAALFVKPDNVDDIVAALKTINKNKKLRAKLITAGKKQALHFSWKKTTQETFAVYKEVIHKNE